MRVDLSVLTAGVDGSRYIYSASWKAYTTGVQMVRGMYIDFPDEEQAYNLSRMIFDNSYVTNPTNVSQEIQFSFGDDFVVSPISRPMQRQRKSTISYTRPQSRRQLDDLRPFVVTNGSCCGPAKTTPSIALDSLTQPVTVVEQIDPDGFTLYPGGWCTGGTKPSSIKCHHSSPIGGIQSCPDGNECETRCKADSKCLAFAWQSSKCYLWPCYAMGVEHVPNPGAVCGNRSAAHPGPAPPAPSPPPSPPAPGPSKCPELGTPIAHFATETLEECISSCDFTSGTAQVGCSTFEWSPYVSTSVPNCAIYNGWPSYINTSKSARANGRVCANRTGGLYPAPAPPPSGHPGRALQDVWIPTGHWMHWDSGEVFSGPQTVSLAAGLADIPAFVRNGAVVPLSSNSSVHELAPDPLRLVVVAIGDEARGSGLVYEDDGDSLLYKDGAFRVMNITHQTAHGTTTLRIDPRAAGDGYDGERSSRTFQINLRTGPAVARRPQSVTVNGHQLAAQDVTILPKCVDRTEFCAFLAEALIVQVKLDLDTLGGPAVVEIRI